MSASNPIDAFNAIFARAGSTAPPPPADHTAAALATVDTEGRPSVRMVLIRQVTAEGFVFFTNYGSRKMHELETNPRAALCFHWHWLEEQVRAEGTVAKTTSEQSDAYFAARPRGHQIAAWASRQSHSLSSRSELEEQYRGIEARFAGLPVPRPVFWGGCRLVPDRIEFWRSGSFRLHERVLYTREDTGWRTTLLYP